MGGAWFKNSDEFTEKFLVNKDQIKMKQLHMPYEAPAGALDPENPGTRIQDPEHSEEGWSMWTIMSLIFLGIIIVGAIVWYFFFRQDDDFDDDDFKDLERIRAERNQNQPKELPVHAVPFVYRPPAASQASADAPPRLWKTQRTELSDTLMIMWSE